MVDGIGKIEPVSKRESKGPSLYTTLSFLGGKVSNRWGANSSNPLPSHFEMDMSISPILTREVIVLKHLTVRNHLNLADVV
jgi:hypothetical protein